MSNIFNRDFQDFLKAFNNNDVDYILLGGYAVILHRYSRTTGDMDVLVRKSKQNYENIVTAFLEFGKPGRGGVRGGTTLLGEAIFLWSKKHQIFCLSA